MRTYKALFWLEKSMLFHARYQIGIPFVLSIAAHLFCRFVNQTGIYAGIMGMFVISAGGWLYSFILQQQEKDIYFFLLSQGVGIFPLLITGLSIPALLSIFNAAIAYFFIPVPSSILLSLLLLSILGALIWSTFTIFISFIIKNDFLFILSTVLPLFFIMPMYLRFLNNNKASLSFCIYFIVSFVLLFSLCCFFLKQKTGSIKLT